MSIDLPELPNGWKWTTVAAVGSTDEQPVLTGPFGTSMGQSDFVMPSDTSVPVLTIGCLRESGIELSKAMFVEPSKAERMDRYRLRHGDMLFSRMATVGRAGFVEQRHSGALFNYHLMRLRLRSDVISSYFFIYFVRGSQTVRDYVRDVNHGMTRDGINTEQLLSLPVPIAPLLTQQRIVEAIDSYLSRLDAAAASLARVEAKLKAYRASVLKAAVEGRLVPTEAALAKQEQRDYEPASVLLDRILGERRRRWEEAELARLTKAGKPPKDDKWKAKYEQPAAPDPSKLPPLPEGWCWATVEQCADVKGGITKGQQRRGMVQLFDVPYLRVANVQRGFLDLREVKTILATDEEIAELRLQPGDVLFNEGGDRDKLGRGWVWESQIDVCIHQNHVFRARIFTSDLRPKFLSWYGNSVGQRYFFDTGKQTTNLASINITKLKSLPIPIPPIREQERISDELDRLLSICDEAEETFSNSAARCTRLRQAVLKWAFEGKLVDQDPRDEPADVLLARIAAERAAAPSPKTRGRRAKSV